MKEIQIVEIKTELGAGTRGASLGIDAIKVASIKRHSDLFTNYPIMTIDVGIADVLYESDNSPAKYIHQIYEIESKICDELSDVAKKYFPIILGGDHSIGAGTLMGIKKANPDKRIGVVWIDAHADLHTPYTSPSGNMHGMPLSMSIAEDNQENAINQVSPDDVELWEKLKKIGGDEAKIQPQDIIFIGLRDTEAPENALIEKYGIKVFSVEDVRKNSAKSIADAALKKLEACDVICISFDVDSMDPDEVSWGTGTPVPGGLTKSEAIDLNTYFAASEKVISWEMVEVNPLLDKENAMAEAAFNVLDEVVKTRESG